MLKSESEIKALPLDELQKLVVELGLVPSNDKNYANSRALLEFATGLKKFKPAEQITVENTADFPIPVDGKVIAPGETAKIYPWQYTSLSRWLSKVAAAAALILATLFLSFAPSAQAQVQPYVFGNPSQYNVMAVNGYAGWTNLLNTSGAATNGTGGWSNIVSTATAVYYTAAITNATTIITNANWQFNTGIWTNIPTYTTNITVNYPGLVSVVNSDTLGIELGGQLLNAGTGTNFVANWDYSNDGVYWQTNALTQSLILNGTTYVATNTQLTLFAPGFLRLDSLSTLPIGATVTNVTVEIAKKPYRTGP